MQEREFERQAEAHAAGKTAADANEREMPIPKVEIAPHSEPAALKLTRLWKCAELKGPGNILVLQQPGRSPRLAVIEAGNSIAELAADGKLLAVHKLDLQPQELIGNLRSAVGADGKRLLVASLPDSSGCTCSTKIGSFSSTIRKTPCKINIAASPTFNWPTWMGSGVPLLYVGYWGDVGVQAVSLEGNCLNKNRFVNPIGAMAVAAMKEGRRLVCANSDGTLKTLDANLKIYPGGADHHRQHLLGWIVGADLDCDGRLQWCGPAIQNRVKTSSSASISKGGNYGATPCLRGCINIPLNSSVQAS